MATDEHQTPGEPPAIRDEAADSPLWLPALGLTLLLLASIFIVWQGATGDEVPVEDGAIAEEAAAAEVDEAEVDEAADAPEDHAGHAH